MWRESLQQGSRAASGQALKLFERVQRYYALANEEDYRKNGQWLLGLAPILIQISPLLCKPTCIDLVYVKIIDLNHLNQYHIMPYFNVIIMFTLFLLILLDSCIQHLGFPPCLFPKDFSPL